MTIGPVFICGSVSMHPYPLKLLTETLMGEGELGCCCSSQYCTLSSLLRDRSWPSLVGSLYITSFLRHYSADFRLLLRQACWFSMDMWLWLDWVAIILCLLKELNRYVEDFFLLPTEWHWRFLVFFVLLAGFGCFYAFGIQSYTSELFWNC